MDRATVYTKTAKGITQVNQRTASLSKDLMKVLKLIDGKSNFGQLLEKADLDKAVLEKALMALAKDGFARVFETRKEEADPFAEEDEFDFTAGKLPGATQRVVASAALDISALARQQDKVDADRKAKEQAHEAARAKARAEAEARAKLEADARAKAEAEQKAMEQAKRAKEAADRAKAELEVKMREEEARKRAIAEQQVKLTVEQKAKEEAESRRLLELRMKAEQEAKALGEARARAEAEAQALAKARAEADKAAQRQAQEAKGAEQEMRARLKEEIEARIRGEMEALLKNEIEEKTRDEMRTQILAEAKLAAKAELEERLREERESIAQAENEARAQADQDARARADIEAKKRAEAEARAEAETRARMKAEAEARQLRAQAEDQMRLVREAEARVKVETEARAREQADVKARIEVERRAKIEAEARAQVEAEERERRERELQETIDSERKAKQEAEARARIEARARETVAADTRAQVQAELEADMGKRAELEGKAQAKAYMEAKQKAELEEEEKMRAEQSRKAREMADVLRTKVETREERAEAAPVKRRKPRGSIVKMLVVGVIAVLVLGIIALHVVPLRTYTAKVEHAMSGWFHDDVSISAMTFRFFPTPHLRLENVAVGKMLDAKASQGRIYLDIFTLLGQKPTIKSIELEGVSLSGEAVRRIPAWGSMQDKSGEIDVIKLKDVRLETQPPVQFDATLNFARGGALKLAKLSAGTIWTLVAKPGEKGIDLEFDAREWSLPMGLPVQVARFGAKGTLSGNEITVPEFVADVFDGKVTGNARITWAQGVKLEADMALERVASKELVAAFTKDIVVTGRMDGNFNFVTTGPTVDKLFEAPRGQGRFRIGEGSISNVDLVAVMKSDTAGTLAGVTKYAEFTGEVGSADHRTSFSKLGLQGGVLRVTGSVDVTNSNLAGKLALEIRSQVAQDRGFFNLSGTVQRPIMRRGG